MSGPTIRFIGGPLDGTIIPFVPGYFREGEAEYIDGTDKRTGLPIPPALYRLQGMALRFVREVEPIDGDRAAPPETPKEAQ